MLTLVLIFVLVLNLSSVSSSIWSSSSNPDYWNNDYGVDHTFPIHHPLNSNDYYGAKYNEFLKGCFTHWSKRECEATELARMEMNLDQPRSQHNYTEIGFKKIRAPPEIWEPLIKFYNDNKHKAVPEKWPRGNTYVNSWDSPSYMVSFEDRNFIGGIDVKNKIWAGAKPIIEEWTGKKITETSLYGIRIYKNGSILNPHVDRLPLVSSCIIQVDQDVDEPWPIEVYSHDGKAHNVTMLPGDMVLYESHTVLHGRPFPMKGSHYANIFVHFAPIDHNDENEDDPKLKKELSRDPVHYDVVSSSVKSMKEQLGFLRHSESGGKLRGSGADHGSVGHEAFNHDEASLKRHLEKPKGGRLPLTDRPDDITDDKGSAPSETTDIDGRTALHLAAASGKADDILNLLGGERGGSASDILHTRDENGWQAIHEAARGGHVEALSLLLSFGADIGSQTNNGGTALWWAKRALGDDHPAVKFLEGIGAPDADIEL